ncbi:hypothetical protein BJX76DRAFT_362139 [Aspergillus varians]
MPPTAADLPSGYMDAYAGDELIETGVVFIILQMLFAAVRYWAKRRQEIKTGLDDWFIWPSLVVNIILCVEGLILIPLAGVGSHLVAVEARSPEKIVAWAKGIYACVWLWALAVALPKIAILGFYLRFFKKLYERAISYILMFIIAATFLATGLTATFECSPIRYQWDKSIPGGRCIKVTTFYRWMSFPNIVTDAVMLVLPLPMVFKLHLSWSQKTGLAIIFATGGVGIITSCLRFAIFYNHDALKDNTWTSVQLLKWTDIEPGIYFLAACMPSFRPLIQRLWNRVVTLSARSGTNMDTIDNGGLALYTIGGGYRDPKLKGHIHGHPLSEMSTGVAEAEPTGGKYRHGHGHGAVLTSVAAGGDDYDSSRGERSPALPSNPGIRVTETVTIDRSRLER